MKKEENGSAPKHIWQKIIIYVICAVLVIFYLLVFWWGKHPNVGIEYRMYYITNELSDWPGYGNLAYELGTVEYCTSLKDRNSTPVTYTVCQRKGQGWEEEQYEGSVNNATTSWIYYLMKENKDAAVLSLDINGYSGDGEVKVYANDELIGTFNEEGQFEFSIEEIKKDELLTIKFVAEDATFSLWSTQVD